MGRPRFFPCPLAVVGVLLIAHLGWTAAAVAAPRLSVPPLDPRYKSGEFIELPVYLEFDEDYESFEYLQFGIQGDPALEVHFFWDVSYFENADLQTFRHRIWDNQRMYVDVGTGGRGFEGPAPEIPVTDGRAFLGILQMVGTKETTAMVETHMLRLGTCQCFDDPDEDPAFVNVDFFTRLDLEVVDIEVNLGEDVFVRGDANVDAAVDMSDALTVFSFLFLGGVEPTCLDALDHDDSGEIDMQDGIANLEFLFLGAPSPPAQPYPDRGPDPTTDDPLNCVEYDTTPADTSS